MIRADDRKQKAKTPEDAPPIDEPPTETPPVEEPPAEPPGEEKAKPTSFTISAP